MPVPKHLVNLTFYVLAGALIFSLYYLNDLNFGVISTDYFPEDEEALNDYSTFKQVFKRYPEHTIGVLIFPEKSIYDSLFLKSLRRTVQEIESDTSVIEVRSLFNLRKPYKVFGGFIDLPIIHPNTPGKYKQDSTEVGENRLLTANFIGLNHKSTFLTVRFRDDASKNEVSKVLKELPAVLKSPQFKENYIVGRPFLENSLSQLMIKELRILGLILILVMILLMRLIFRSTGLVLVTLGIIIFSMVLTYGIYGFFGFRLEILSNILPVLIILFSITNSLHVYKKYQYEISEHVGREAVGRKVVSEKFPDIILANMTTALGFGSLYFSALPAMKHFGLYAALAIFTTLIVNLICFKFLFSRPFFGNMLSGLSLGSTRPSHRFIALYKKLLSRKGLRMQMGIALSLILLGVFQMDINTKKLTNLPDVNNLKKGILKYGENYFGVAGFDLMIHSNQKGREYKNALIASDTISKYLEQQGITNIRSVAAVQNWIYTQFGRTDLDLGQTGSEKLQLYSDTEKLALVSGRMEDIGRIKREEIKRGMRPLLSSLAAEFQLDFVFTGEDYLNNLAHSYRIREMLLGLALSILLVSLVILIWFKSWTYFFISFIINMLPLLMVAGLMGWFKIELRGSSSLLFTIGYAIAVDDTIHFLSEYRRNASRFPGRSENILTTFAQVSNPIFFSSLILSTGFIVLLFSSMWDLFVFGLLIALFVMIAMFCDLIVLPLLIYYLKRSGHAQK